MSLAIDESPFLPRGVVGCRDPAQSAVKAHVKDRAPILAVGYRLKAEAFLELDHLANRGVFDRAKFRDGNFARFAIGARAQQLGGRRKLPT